MRSGLWIAILLGLGASVSCSGATKEKLLGVFFDDPPRAEEEARADSAGAEEPAAPEGTEQTGTVAAPSGSVHPPYAERRCWGCHSLTGSKSFAGVGSAQAAAGSGSHEARLLYPKDELCVQCHTEMTYEALEERGEYLHGPTGAGECLECHEPHKSQYANLLSRGDPFENLCFSCHDSEDVFATDPHGDLEGEACNECHDPHVSDQESLLR